MPFVMFRKTRTVVTFVCRVDFHDLIDCKNVSRKLIMKGIIDSNSGGSVIGI
jgi:hypothetical protein